MLNKTCVFIIWEAISPHHQSTHKGTGLAWDICLWPCRLTVTVYQSTNCILIVWVAFGVDHHFGAQPQIGETRLKNWFFSPTFWQHRGGALDNLLQRQQQKQQLTTTVTIVILWLTVGALGPSCHGPTDRGTSPSVSYINLNVINVSSASPTTSASSFRR